MRDSFLVPLSGVLILIINPKSGMSLIWVLIVNNTLHIIYIAQRCKGHLNVIPEFSFSGRRHAAVTKWSDVICHWL